MVFVFIVHTSHLMEKTKLLAQKKTLKNRTLSSSATYELGDDRHTSFVQFRTQYVVSLSKHNRTTGVGIKVDDLSRIFVCVHYHYSSDRLEKSHQKMQVKEEEDKMKKKNIVTIRYYFSCSYGIVIVSSYKLSTLLECRYVIAGTLNVSARGGHSRFSLGYSIFYLFCLPAINWEKFKSYLHFLTCYMNNSMALLMDIAFASILLLFLLSLCRYI